MILRDELVERYKIGRDDKDKIVVFPFRTLKDKKYVIDHFGKNDFKKIKIIKKGQPPIENLEKSDEIFNNYKTHSERGEKYIFEEFERSLLHSLEEHKVHVFVISNSLMKRKMEEYGKKFEEDEINVLCELYSLENHHKTICNFSKRTEPIKEEKGCNRCGENLLEEVENFLEEKIEKPIEEIVINMDIRIRNTDSESGVIDNADLIIVGTDEHYKILDETKISPFYAIVPLDELKKNFYDYILLINQELTKVKPKDKYIVYMIYDGVENGDYKTY